MSMTTQDFYPLILDSIAEGVFTVDSEYRITYFNPAAEAITGYCHTEVHGRKCYEVFRASVCQGQCPMRRSLETQQPQHNLCVTMLNSTMEEIPIRVSCAVMRDPAGNLMGGVEIFSDISEVEALRSQLSQQESTGDLIGLSPAMRKICQLIPDLAASNASVLIQGDSGTGKELIAKAIHDQSPRKDGEFVRVNCGALPDTLLESELFGYVRGAFTDAKRNKIGRFQQAHKGTLFLDELGDLSPAFQVKLLRVLQDGIIQPLGSTETLNADVRIIAATNRNLGRLIERGEFREDLYYRVCVFPIVIPPLRERREDILPLLKHYISFLEVRTGKKIREISADAITALYDFDYPGNVRQLINILERAFVVCRSDTIDLSHLPPEVVTSSGDTPPIQPEMNIGNGHEKSNSTPIQRSSSSFSDSVSPTSLSKLKPSEHKLLSAYSEDPSSQTPHVQYKAKQLLDILHTNQWNRGATASSLGISRSTLWRRMKEYGLS